MNYRPMKISQELYTKMYNLLHPNDKEEYRQRYREGNFPNSHTVKCLNTRYRWDLYWAFVGTQSEVAKEIRANREIGDSHINTALALIIPDL